MTEQEVLFPGKFSHDSVSESMYVINDDFPAVFFGEIAELLIIFGGGAVSDVVMAEYGAKPFSARYVMNGLYRPICSTMPCEI